MSRPLIVIAAFLCLAVPAALAAPPADKGKPESPGKSAAAPGQQADKSAAKTCKAERGTTSASRTAFKSKYGSNGLGKCIQQNKAEKDKEDKAKDEDEDEEDEKGENEFAKTCKAERGTTSTSIAAFMAKYGSRGLGKCIQRAKGHTS
jgi:hypothetical protein